MPHSKPLYLCTKVEVLTTLISILTTWQNRTESKCLSSLRRRRFFGGGTQKSRRTRGIWKHRIPPLCLSLPFLLSEEIERGNMRRKGRLTHEFISKGNETRRDAESYRRSSRFRFLPSFFSYLATSSPSRNRRDRRGWPPARPRSTPSRGRSATSLMSLAGTRFADSLPPITKSTRTALHV